MNTKYLFTFFLINLSISVFGQTYLLPNEILIFSFKSDKGKIVAFAKDKNNKYIIYRFGTKDNIEFEFPEKSVKSWKKFKYSHYLRGGGKKKLAENLSSVSFVNKDYEYRLYDYYFSESNEYEIGVLILNLKTRKTTKIRGKLKTKKGTLNGFDGSNLLEIDEEI